MNNQSHVAWRRRQLWTSRGDDVSRWRFPRWKCCFHFPTKTRILIFSLSFRDWQLLQEVLSLRVLQIGIHASAENTHTHISSLSLWKDRTPSNINWFLWEIKKSGGVGLKRVRHWKSTNKRIYLLIWASVDQIQTVSNCKLWISSSSPRCTSLLWIIMLNFSHKEQ